MQFIKELFKSIDGVTVFTELTEDYFSNHWLPSIILDAQKVGFSGEDLRLELLKENIETRPLWKPMHLQPIFKNALYYGEKVSKNIFNSGLCLPSGSNLTQDDLNIISSVIKSII